MIAAFSIFFINHYSCAFQRLIIKLQNFWNSALFTQISLNFKLAEHPTHTSPNTSASVIITIYMEQLDTKQSLVQTISPQRLATQLKLQTKAGAAIAKWLKQAGKSKNRYYRLRELVKTEGDYLNDLFVIKDHIKKPLSDAGLISESEEKKMFANIESMIGLSAELRKELDQKLASWNRHTTLIGHTMKKYAKFLLVYSDYFKNLSSTQLRLKDLLSTRESVKEIQRRLSTQTSIVTFEDMMSKPFQRPLKYHLILRDYASKTPQNHPDLKELNEAIALYHKVNEQNNEALVDKEKDQMLIQLDRRFGDIIRQGEGARSYLARFESILIDVGVDLFLFSDMLLISFKGKYTFSDKTQLRVQLDRWSYIERASDGHYFMNRIYLYGKRHCFHFSFIDKQTFVEFENTIGRIITDIQLNQANREQKMSADQRITRKTLMEQRKSYTQLKPQVKRPLVATILGNDERCFEENKMEEYYVIQYHSSLNHLDGATPPHQIALVTLKTLLLVQRIAKSLYPELQAYPIYYCPRSMTKSQLQNNKDMRHQIRTIFIQLMLNTIFRDSIISKRLDIYAHLLGVSDVLWEYLRVPNICQLKMCPACSQKSSFKDYEEYHRDQRKRYFSKSDVSNKRIFQEYKNVQYCDRKTIHMRIALQKVNAAQIKTVGIQPRLQWVKARFGWINHVFTQPKPASTRLSAKIFFCNVSSSTDGIEVEFNTSQKVRQIRSLLAQRLKVNLQDYTLAAVINRNVYLLSEDQPIGSILGRPKEEQEGFFSSFFKKQPYRIELQLRKVWFMESNLEIQCPDRKIHLKAEQLIYRIKHQQIKLRDLNHYSEVYAWYYCFKHFIELDTLSYYLIKKRTEEFDKILPDNMREKIIKSLYSEIQKIKIDKTITHQNQLAKRIIHSVLESPVGSCYFFEAQLRPECIMVKIGCDYRGIKVRDRANLLFEFNFTSTKPAIGLNGYQLTLNQDKQYVFYSKDMWQLKTQVEIYYAYYTNFILT